MAEQHETMTMSAFGGYREERRGQDLRERMEKWQVQGARTRKACGYESWEEPRAVAGLKVGPLDVCLVICPGQQ